MARPEVLSAAGRRSMTGWSGRKSTAGWLGRRSTAGWPGEGQLQAGQEKVNGWLVR